MARPGYISLYADERTQNIFDAFTKEKGITKSIALTEMMQIYMIAQDENLYMDLLKESFNVSKAKELILQAEDETEINDYIFMKLGDLYTSNGETLNGQQTMEVYMEALKGHGHTWFSTMSLHTGMAKEKVKFYNSAIAAGKTVKLLFAIGMGINEVCYSAVLERIVSSRNEIFCPGDKTSIPDALGPNTKGKIWFEIKSLEEENEIKADMLRFRKDNGSVKAAITSSQCHFGYVYLDA